MGKSVSTSAPPPPEKRTLPFGTVAQPDAADGATDWTERARTLIGELERALASPNASTTQALRIDRAWFAWTLGGSSDATIQHVAHLVQRAYDALHQASPRKPSRKSSGLAVSNCAQVLHSGLPPSVRDRLDFSEVMAIVHELERAVERRPAVVKATSELLGWEREHQRHAAAIVKQALATKLG